MEEFRPEKDIMYDKKYQNDKISPYVIVIMSYVNGWNSPIKSHKSAEWISKIISNSMLSRGD